MWISLTNQTLSVSAEATHKPIKRIELKNAVVRNNMDGPNPKLQSRSSTLFSFAPSKGENTVIVDVNGDADNEADRLILGIAFSDKIKKVGLVWSHDCHMTLSL